MKVTLTIKIDVETLSVKGTPIEISEHTVDVPTLGFLEVNPHMLHTAAEAAWLISGGKNWRHKIDESKPETDDNVKK